MSYEVVGSEIANVSPEGAEENDKTGLEDAANEPRGEHSGVAGPRGLGQEGWIDGFNAQGLGRWAIHEDVWMQG